jgi:hypothetical protein
MRQLTWCSLLSTTNNKQENDINKRDFLHPKAWGLSGCLKEVMRYYGACPVIITIITCKPSATRSSTDIITDIIYSAAGR